MDKQQITKQQTEQIRRDIGHWAEYHGELGCLDPGHEKQLVVDVLDDGEFSERGYFISLSIWREAEDINCEAEVGLFPDEARLAARHLLRAARVADRANARERQSLDRTTKKE